MTVNVTERQFAFEFSYPQAGGKQSSPPSCTCPRASRSCSSSRSLDVIHSFFVPEFSEKLDAVPGITTTLRVTPTRLGTYPAECTELCGAGHSLMRATVHVVSPARFQTWLAPQKPNGPPPLGTPPPAAADPASRAAPAARALQARRRSHQRRRPSGRRNRVEHGQRGRRQGRVHRSAGCGAVIRWPPPAPPGRRPEPRPSG